MDVVKLPTRVRVQIPVEPDGEVGQVVALDVLVVEHDVRIPRRDFPGSEARLDALRLCPHAEDVLKRFEPFVDPQLPVVGAVLAGKEVAHLGHVGIEEQLIALGLVHDGKCIFRLQRQRPHDQGKLGVEELEVVGLDVAGIDEDRGERPRHAVDVVARSWRPHWPECARWLLLADFRGVFESDLVLKGLAVTVGRAQMHVKAAVAGLVPPGQERAPHRQCLAAIERVVADIVAVGAEGADGPGGELVFRVAVSHHTHVAGGGKRVDQRPFHESVVAVLRDAFQREGLEEVADANILQPGQFLPLDVVVEVAGLIGQCEVNAERVFEHFETRAAGADPEPAKLGTVLQITNVLAAGGILSEVDLVGLHLPRKDQRRFFCIFFFLFVIGVDECGQALLESRQPIEERLIVRVAGCVCRFLRRLFNVRRSPVGTECLDFLFQSLDVVLQAFNHGHRRRNLFHQQRLLRHAASGKRDQAGRSHGGTHDRCDRSMCWNRKERAHSTSTEKAVHAGGPLAVCHGGHQTSRTVFFIVIFTPPRDVAGAGKASHLSELRK